MNRLLAAAAALCLTLGFSTAASAGVFLIIADGAERQTLLSYNDPGCDALTGYSGAHQQSTNAPGYCINPRAITAPPPYPYAGQYALGAAIASNPNYVQAWNFLAGLPVVEIEPVEAWPPEE